MKTFFFLLTIKITFCVVIEQNILLKGNQKQHFPFERKIWTYWNSYDGEVPLIVQACLSNMEIVAKKHNFTFVCLNEDNVRDYIENYDQEFLEVRRRSIQYGNAHAADLLRILVLEQHGGMWVDSTTIFINGLTELENIMSEKYRNMITNRFSSEPDMLLFHFSMGQNRIWEYIPDPSNSSLKILYNELPNLEIWAILTKKRSPIISQIKKTYVEFTCTPVPILTQKMISQDIYFHRINEFGHYLYLNMAVSYTLQKKQLELDRNLQIIGTRKSAFEEYKLWGLHAQFGPFATLKDDQFGIDDLFLCSKEELEDRGLNLRFFIKYTGYFRYVMNLKFTALKYAFGSQNQTFQSFMIAGPTFQQCKHIVFPVQNSVIHWLLNSSKLIEQNRIPIFSKQQSDIYRRHCERIIFQFPFNLKEIQFIWKEFKKDTFVDTIIHMLIFPDKIHKAKSNQIVAINQGILSINEWIKILWKDNIFLVLYSVLILILSLLIYALYRKLFSFFRAKVLKIFNVKKQHSDASRQIKSEVFVIRVVMFTVFLINMMLFNAVDIHGGRQQPLTIFFCITLTFVAQSWIQKQIKLLVQKDENQDYLTSENLFLMNFVNYFVAYLGLLHVRKNRFMLNYYSFVLGLIGPCIIKLDRLLNNQHDLMQNSKSTWNIKINIHRYITVTMLLITNIFPNLRYISGPSSGYYIKFTPILLVGYIFIRFIKVLFSALRKNQYYELARLNILLALSIILYQNITVAEQIIPSINRNLYVGRIVLFVAVINLQMGTQRRLKDIQKIVNRKIMGLGLIGILVYQMLFGRLCKQFSFNQESWFTYTGHALLLGYAALLSAFFASISTLRAQPKLIQMKNQLANNSSSSNIANIAL